MWDWKILFWVPHVFHPWNSVTLTSRARNFTGDIRHFIRYAWLRRLLPVYCRKQSRKRFIYRKKEDKKGRMKEQKRIFFLGCAPIYEVIDSSDVPSSKSAPPPNPIPSLRAFCTSFQTKLQSIQVGSISKYSRWIIHGSYEFQIKYLLTLYLKWKESIYFTLLSVKLPCRIHQQYVVPAATGERQLHKLPHKSSRYKEI